MSSISPLSSPENEPPVGRPKNRRAKSQCDWALTHPGEVRGAHEWELLSHRHLTRTKSGELGGRAGDEDLESVAGDNLGSFHEFETALAENFISVFSLSLFIVTYCWALLGVNLFSVSLMIYLFLAVVGLAIFGIGLRQGMMPLGETVGAHLPMHMPLYVVMLVVFALGILCTIAEPAIAALREVGQHTNYNAAPLLAMILAHPDSLMVAVGVGVGVAAVFGCTRLIFDLPMKVCLNLTVIPAMIATAVCRQVYGGSFLTITGLAWDCGAVTTGPVTVPIVLALGIGVAASAKIKRKHKLEEAAAKFGSSPLGGQPMVRRRSTAPPSWKPGYEEDECTVAESVAEIEAHEIEHVRLLMRKHTMLEGLDPLATNEDLSDDTGDEDLSGFGIVAFASIFPVLSIWVLGALMGGASLTPADYEAAQGMVTSNATSASTIGLVAYHRNHFLDELLDAADSSCRAILPLAAFLLFTQLVLIREKLENPFTLFCGLLECLVGMFIFNLGLFGALVPLGHGAGVALPNAITLYGPNVGPLVIISFGFLSGMGATFSEPALVQLGITVERLTNGQFKRSTITMAVAIGVGSGIALGMSKVYYNLNIWVILLVGYISCLVLTQLSSEAVVCIAWDAAGVTTGPVTVPIVLASGLALAETVHADEGFGILTCASIGPVFSVLIAGFFVSPSPSSNPSSPSSNSPLGKPLLNQPAEVL